MRIQFYPSEELEKALEKDAKDKNVAINVLVVDLLSKHYGLIPANKLSNMEIRAKIIEEIKEYVQDVAEEKEFDLNEASTTYSNLSMIYSGKPSALKAQIGKEFNKCYVGKEEPFTNVEQVRLQNGKPKKSVGNRAALYMVKRKQCGV